MCFGRRLAMVLVLNDHAHTVLVDAGPCTGRVTAVRVLGPGESVAAAADGTLAAGGRLRVSCPTCRREWRYTEPRAAPQDITVVGLAP